MHLRGGSGLPLDGSGNDAAAERLCQDQAIADSGGIVADNLLRMDQTGNSQPVLQLFILNRMTADEADTCFFHGILTTAENFCQNISPQSAGREKQQIQGGNRPAPHGKYIGDGVGRSDPAKGKRIIHQGGYDISRLYEGATLRYPVNTRIVGAADADQQIRIRRCRNSSKYVGKARRAEFSGSTGSLDQLGQLYRSSQQDHHLFYFVISS